MFGHNNKDQNDATLPIFVHSIVSAEAFKLAQKIWQVNEKIRLFDQGNGKEFERFVFPNPACVVWLQRDNGRQDNFELILVWGKKEVGATEVYSISDGSEPKGDASRARQLLEKILITPATVPVNQRQDR